MIRGRGRGRPMMMPGMPFGYFPDVHSEEMMYGMDIFNFLSFIQIESFQKKKILILF